MRHPQRPFASDPSQRGRDRRPSVQRSSRCSSDNVGRAKEVVRWRMKRDVSLRICGFIRWLPTAGKDRDSRVYFGQRGKLLWRRVRAECLCMLKQDSLRLFGRASDVVLQRGSLRLAKGASCLTWPIEADNTHLLPTTRSSAVAMFHEQVTRSHLCRRRGTTATIAVGVREIVRTWQRRNLLLTDRVGPFPDRRIVGAVVEVGKLARVGEAHLPILRRRHGCLQ